MYGAIVDLKADQARWLCHHPAPTKVGVVQSQRHLSLHAKQLYRDRKVTRLEDQVHPILD